MENIRDLAFSEQLEAVLNEVISDSNQITRSGILEQIVKTARKYNLTVLEEDFNVEVGIALIGKSASGKQVRELVITPEESVILSTDAVFQRLREATDSFKERHGTSPKFELESRISFLTKD